MFSTTPISRRWDKLVYHEEIAEALHSGKPIVALETTIVTHGLPYPTNLDLTLSLSKIIREQGAVPATIAILEGRPTIGLTQEELERLADPSVAAIKVSRRDLAPAMAFKKDGGTTVAGTMYLARQAGIDVFATGGIGGVHRGGELSMDISADLTELGRTPLAVVCAGAKSILDIGRTLEYLETEGVSVATYGETTDFPAFYTPKSGFQSPWNVTNARSAASLIHTGLTLPDPISTLLAVPIPSSFWAAGNAIQSVVEQAVRIAKEQGIRGKETTPFLLKRVSELTKNLKGGTSIQSNIGLIRNNTTIASQVAVELARLKKEGSARPKGKDEDLSFIDQQYFSGVDLPVHSSKLSSIPLPPTPPASPPSSPATTTSSPPSLVVIGSIACDITSSSSSSALGSASTLPGQIRLSPGGVSLNLALAASRLLPPRPSFSSKGSSPSSSGVRLISPIGDDAFGRLLGTEMDVLGLGSEGLCGVEGGRTAAVSLVLDGNGALEGGVADFEVMDDFGWENQIACKLLPLFNCSSTSPPKILAFDGNLLPGTITSLLAYTNSRSDRSINPLIPSFFEPTSVTKSVRIIPAILAGHTCTIVSPNLAELGAMYGAARENGALDRDDWWATIDSLGLDETWRNRVESSGRRWGITDLVREGVVQMMSSLTPFFPIQVVKLGARGVLSLRRVPAPDSSTLTQLRLPSTLLHESPNYILKLTCHPSENVPIEEQVSSTGNGDSLCGALLAGISELGLETAIKDGSWEALVERAQRAARASLRSTSAVSPDLGRDESWDLGPSRKM